MGDYNPVALFIGFVIGMGLYDLTKYAVKKWLCRRGKK